MQTLDNFRRFIQIRRLISIAGLLFYPVVLWVFRPNYLGDNIIILMILGSLPHFLAGLLLPVSALKPELIIKFPDKFHHFFIAICLFVFVWLVMEEFWPIFSPTAVTDPYDIVFGGLGVLAGFLLYQFYFRRIMTTKT